MYLSGVKKVYGKFDPLITKVCNLLSVFTLLVTCNTQGQVIGDDYSCHQVFIILRPPHDDLKECGYWLYVVWEGEKIPDWIDENSEVSPFLDRYISDGHAEEFLPKMRRLGELRIDMSEMKPLFNKEYGPDGKLS
jgi:hypothetical protein